jgi:predicted AlkP superfamily phosphohydrolase/phosphomutase
MAEPAAKKDGARYHRGDEEIYIQDAHRMVTIKHTTNRVYITGYVKDGGEWGYSWIVETTTDNITQFSQGA